MWFQEFNTLTFTIYFCGPGGIIGIHLSNPRTLALTAEACEASILPVSTTGPLSHAMTSMNKILCRLIIRCRGQDLSLRHIGLQPIVKGIINALSQAELPRH